MVSNRTFPEVKVDIISSQTCDFSDRIERDQGSHSTPGQVVELFPDEDERVHANVELTFTVHRVKQLQTLCKIWIKCCDKFLVTKLVYFLTHFYLSISCSTCQRNPSFPQLFVALCYVLPVEYFRGSYLLVVRDFFVAKPAFTVVENADLRN